MNSEYNYDDTFTVTEQVKRAFHENGYFILRGVLDAQEVGLVWQSLEHPDGLLKHAYVTHEADGNYIRRIHYAHPGNDVTGLIARSEKIAGTCEKLMGGELYHYHSKFIMKDAGQGGQIHWHQDYGYWYDYGCLFPDLISAFIALDPCKKENGCLEVVPGSNKCGRIDHRSAGQLQTEADGDRVNEILKVCPRQYAELNPGDVLFIHCNILHTSRPNNSDMRRWAFIACYNMRRNNPVNEEPHPQYTPMEKVPNESIRNCTNLTDFTGKIFKNPLENRRGWPPVNPES